MSTSHPKFVPPLPGQFDTLLDHTVLPPSFSLKLLFCAVAEPVAMNPIRTRNTLPATIKKLAGIVKFASGNAVSDAVSAAHVRELYVPPSVLRQLLAEADQLE